MITNFCALCARNRVRRWLTRNWPPACGAVTGAGLAVAIVQWSVPGTWGLVTWGSGCTVTAAGTAAMLTWMCGWKPLTRRWRRGPVPQARGRGWGTAAAVAFAVVLALLVAPGLMA
jgi:hypothetical protein